MKSSNKKVLVTGGAGYIGSQNCKNLHDNGYHPITYDNLSEGNSYAVKWGPLIEADLQDQDRLIFELKKHTPIAVMHFAANALVGESMENHQKYYENNVKGTINLLNAMLKAKIKYLIFSSTCATYGVPMYMPLDENHPQNPISPYGKTKYMIEQILTDYSNAYGIKFAALRYFNAAGADLQCELGEDRKLETHLIPLAIDANISEKPFNVFGNNFDTPDGTAIRDYIHVQDLASAHLKSLQYLFENDKNLFLNLGSEKGFSVLEVIFELEKLTGKKMNLNYAPPRLGDPSKLFAKSLLAKRILKWDLKHSELKTILNTALKWEMQKKIAQKLL